jgi:amiloride-sensitive sodium channel
MLQIFETEKSWSLEINLQVGALVYLHSVREVFSYDARAQFSYEPENTVDLLISMKETYTTEDANQLSVTQRKCIFPGEMIMNFHQEKDEEYSLSACMKECRMKRAISFCKCIPPFYAPQKNSKFSYCTLQNMTCIHQYASNITDITKCSDCELSCDNTVYEIEKFSKSYVENILNLNQILNYFYLLRNPATATGAVIESDRIRIEFLTWPIIRYKREVLFGWVDLLVSFGGIAGLFLGFSLLSGIEIIYYFTVRAGCMMYKNRVSLRDVKSQLIPVIN